MRSTCSITLTVTTTLLYVVLWAPSARADEPAAKATPAQKKLKHLLVNLADITEQSIPELEPGFELLRRDVATGDIVEPGLKIVPNAKVFAHKLNEIISELTSKSLDTERLEPILADLPAAEISMGASAAAAAAAAAAEPPSIVEELKRALDDRIGRVSDLLTFQPDFLTQLATADANEFSPITKIFRQLVLCASDDAMCQVDIIPMTPHEDEAPSAADEPAPGEAQAEPEAPDEPEPPAEPTPPEDDDEFDEFEVPLEEPEPESILAPPKTHRKKGVIEDRQEEGYYKVKQVQTKHNSHYSEQQRHQYVYNGRSGIPGMMPLEPQRPRRIGRQ